MEHCAKQLCSGNTEVGANTDHGSDDADVIRWDIVIDVEHLVSAAGHIMSNAAQAMQERLDHANMVLVELIEPLGVALECNHFTGREDP